MCTDRHISRCILVSEVAVRTNIVLDDALVEEARRLTGIATKRELVHEALTVLVQVRRRRSLLDLEGKIRFADGYDHRALRDES
jgi:Arc/MetJ family transcription regulator